ncbi:MAG: bifunctional folylpolyglutamate synthase/dihydrofolate synthase [Paludibacter sp.]|nr:bifunctional folylpolyglutamate synthase/dihydrofolate synthase [Paludibacter sp.]
MTYSQTIQYLYAQTPAFHQVGAVAYKPGLQNTRKLMNALGNPQKKFKAIHIAGTNGKGSVSHYLAACLQKAGYTTGLYTSPHLVDFAERIRIDGQKIGRKYVVDFVKKNKNLLETIKPSFFEFTMAMAFCFFADREIDIAVVETGLGGRLDSTNILRPVLSVITNIAFDHTEFLGNTLEKIAQEKAGIIKRKIPVVIGEATEQTHPVFVNKANEKDAPIFFAKEKYQITKNKDLPNGKMSFQVISKENNNFDFECFSGLCGIYQLNNLATVLTAIDVLNKYTKYNVYVKNIFEGLAFVSELTGLQGRWQTIGYNPKIVVDTAHNPAGIAQVVKQIQIEHFDLLHIVFGMAADKDIPAVLALLPQNAVYYFTQAKTQRAISTKDLQTQAEKYQLLGEAFHSVSEAVSAAKKNANANDMIFIGGSNFVVGEALDN